MEPFAALKTYTLHTSPHISGACCNPGARGGGSLIFPNSGGHLLGWTTPPHSCCPKGKDNIFSRKCLSKGSQTAQKFTLTYQENGAIKKRAP